MVVFLNCVSYTELCKSFSPLTVDHTIQPTSTSTLGFHCTNIESHSLTVHHKPIHNRSPPTTTIQNNIETHTHTSTTMDHNHYPQQNPPAFPLLALYATHVPNIDEFWSQLFTQLAHKISPPGLNISGQTLFSMKASALSATPGNASNANATEMHVGSASIVSANVTQQKMSVQRGHTKLSTLLMTTRSQTGINKPRKGRLVSGSVAIPERGLGAEEAPAVVSPSADQTLRDLFPLRCNVASQQFSVSLPVLVISAEHLDSDPVLLQLVIESFLLLKRLITMYTFLSSDSDVLNQSTQLLERTVVMKQKLHQLSRWCDLKSKMIKEELLNQYCLTMKDVHGLSWTATSSLKIMIDLALASREHKSLDVNVDQGVVIGIKDIEYDPVLRRFVNRRWSGKAALDHKDAESDSDTDTESDTDTDTDTDTDSTMGEDPLDETEQKVNVTALKLMPQLEPSPLILPHHSIPLQTPGPRKFVIWGKDDVEKLRTHHDVARNYNEKVDLIHAYERMVIAGNR